MKKLIIGNWKLNPETLTGAIKLAKAVDKRGVIVCPPHAFLGKIAGLLKNSAPCAQDVFYEQKGSFTGGVSPSQLKTIGVKHTLVGHSSRKAKGETDGDVNKKIKAAFDESLTVILCVGEPINIHKGGITAVKKFVEAQVKKALLKIKPGDKLIIVYEPIWAIGTKKPDTPEESALVIAHIKDILGRMKWKNIRVLYGGSVNGQNAKGFLREKMIDGLLVGMASLDAKEFNKIIGANG